MPRQTKAALVGKIYCFVSVAVAAAVLVVAAAAEASAASAALATIAAVAAAVSDDGTFAFCWQVHRKPGFARAHRVGRQHYPPAVVLVAVAMVIVVVAASAAATASGTSTTAHTVAADAHAANCKTECIAGRATTNEPSQANTALVGKFRCCCVWPTFQPQTTPILHKTERDS